MPPRRGFISHCSEVNNNFLARDPLNLGMSILPDEPSPDGDNNGTERF